MTSKNLTLFAVLSSAILASRAVPAQVPAAPTVEAGVYSDVQAIRGAAAYDQACGRCHRQDLGGADGPALKDERFNRNFAGKDLRTLYTRIVTTMPRGAPASLSDSAYLDILAHILKENGFPAGAGDLGANGLDGVQVLKTRLKPLPPVGDFSYVEVMGCLAEEGDGTWVLANAGEPAAAVAPDSPPRGSERALSLGIGRYPLLDALAYRPESLRGHKLQVRGLLINAAGERRITISDLKALSPACN